MTLKLWRLVVLALLTPVAMNIAVLARAAETPAPVVAPAIDCINQEVAFDGIRSLHYFKVSGDSNSKLHLHQQYPSRCSTTDADSCEGSSYLLPGDAVAVGKTCGAWSYVQYIGEQHVGTGWVEAARLVETSSTEPPASPPFSFKLIRGQGRPICEAYLQRLNSTNYGAVPDPPFCDRPEYGSDGIPGFTRLNRIMLDRQEVNALFPTVFNFWYPQRGPEADGMLARRRGDVGEIIDPVYAWRYDPPVDIDNDGAPDNLLLWRGDGVGDGGCRSIGRRSWTERPDQVPLFMEADNKTVDVDRTTDLLKSDVPISAQAAKFRSATGAVSRFGAIGRSVGIFQYKGVYYMDAFSAPSGNYAGERLKSPEEANILNVFLRKDKRTSKVCTYVMSGSDFPLIDEGD